MGQCLYQDAKGKQMIQHYTYNTVTVMLKGNINLYLGKKDCKEMCENVNNG